MGKMTRRQTVSVVKSVAMFSALDDGALEDFLRDCHLERAPDGVIQVEGPCVTIRNLRGLADLAEGA